MKTLDIQFFLHFGYFPHYDQRYHLDFSHIDKCKYLYWPEQKLLAKSAGLVRECIEAEYLCGRRNIVPLSGGMDSRMILALLLEHTEARNIETYTFGTPGTYDYDIGNLVARRVGTKQTSIPLNNITWQQSELYEIARRFDAQTLLFHHPPLKLIQQFSDGVIWSGYIGDVVTGGHLKNERSITIEKAKGLYMQYRRPVCSMSLTTASHEDFFPLLKGGDISSNVVSLYEQVFLFEVGSVTAPQILMNGFVYKTPFINNSFFDLFMSIPNHFRQSQRLFKAMLVRTWPEMFSMPTKSWYGMRIESPRWRVLARRVRLGIERRARPRAPWLPWRSPSPMTNYLDFDRALREQQDLQDVVRACLADLKRRKIVDWLDLDAIWRRHQRKLANHGDALTMLASLEINLKVLEGTA